MLDINIVRDNLELVRKDLERRGAPEKFKLAEEVHNLDKKRRQLITAVNELKHRRNVVSELIGRLKAEGKDASKELAEIREIPAKIKKMDRDIQRAEERIKDLLFRLPNPLHDSVPVGDGEEDNVEVRRWGKERKFNFTPRDHIDLGLSLNLIDTEKAAKVSGARFYYLKNELVVLNYALISFALDMLRRKGFILHQPPYMLRRRAVESATDLGDFEEVIYKIDNEDLYLLATSEHALLALHMDEILPVDTLPLRYGGISPCFRKEAGTHGRDTKGIFRVHQFEKVEQFVFCRPEDSWKEHELLVSNAEDILKKLDIPYRVMNVCTGDIGSVAAKKYDIEAWLPGQKAYREVVSCSNCTDYQARRAEIRYRDKKGNIKFVHTLNSTLVATERMLVSILENYQTDEGIEIPKPLRPYAWGLRKIT